MTDLPPWLLSSVIVIAVGLGITHLITWCWGKELQRKRFRPGCQCDHPDAELCARLDWNIECRCPCHERDDLCRCREDQ